MPGFSLICRPEHEIAALSSRCELALGRMLHDKRYMRTIAYQDDLCALFWTGYEGYPIQTWKTEECVLMIEGCVYGGDTSTLKQLLDETYREPGGIVRAADFLRDWTSGADGDFVILYIRKRPPRGVVLALDALGRLPVYWALDGGRLLASREVKFISALSESVEPDTVGIAETLLFAFPLEERTLLRGISRLPPGAILQWEPDRDPQPKISRHLWAFPTTAPAGEDMSLCAENLANEFVASCERRARSLEGRPLILSLSGGLDSRAVAAAFKRLGRPLVAWTFMDGSTQRDRDADRAAMIASAADFDWKSIRLSTPSLEACDRLVITKDGLNSAAMAYAEEYLAAIVRDCGDKAVLLSGGGGDLALPPRHPYRTLASCGDLAGLLLSRSTIFDPETVAQLTGTTANALRERLTGILDTYPEEDFPGRYLHFCLMGFEFKNYFEGDDRNRCYLWTVAPFYGQPFFAKAMAAPFAWKRRRRLQIAFLRWLGEDIARISSANTGLVPGSLVDQARQWLREVSLSSRAAEILWFAQRRKRSSHAFVAPALASQKMIDTVTKSAVIDALFDRRRMLEILRTSHSEQQYWLLYTLTRYLFLLDRPSTTGPTR